jgi:hypothetical protein
MKPIDLTRMSGIFASQRILASWRDKCSFNPVAITIENCLKNCGFDEITSSGFYGQFLPSFKTVLYTCTTNFPSTSGFISLINKQASSPLPRPILPFSRKKLTPTSSPSVTLSSRIVNPPMPGHVSCKVLGGVRTGKDEIFEDFCSCCGCVDETETGVFECGLAV